MGTSKFIFTRLLFTGLTSQAQRHRVSVTRSSFTRFSFRTTVGKIRFWRNKDACHLDAQTGTSVPCPSRYSANLHFRERSILFYLQRQREKHWYVSQLPARVPPSRRVPARKRKPTPALSFRTRSLGEESAFPTRCTAKAGDPTLTADWLARAHTRVRHSRLYRCAFPIPLAPEIPPKTQTAPTKRSAPSSLPSISRIPNWKAKPDTLSRFIFPGKSIT